MSRNSTIDIRILDEGDAEAVARLSTELGYPTDAGAVALRIRRILQHPDHTAFVAVEDDQPIGWLHLFVNYPIESAPCAEIAGLVVAETRRGNGIGGQLMDTAKQWARDRALESLRVRCQVRRHDAHRFYRTSGFTETKIQKMFTLSLTRR